MKLNCESCKLRTEHYIQIRDGTLILCRCLRCGQTKRSLMDKGKPYPSDDRKPIYVF